MRFSKVYNQPRVWEFKNDNNFYTIEISPELAHFLNQNLEVRLDSENRIVSLNNVLIEEVFIELIDDNIQNYHFGAKDWRNFDMAIQEIKNNAS